VDALATYNGSLECWNWSDLHESGGVPFAQLAVWSDRLEMTARGPLKAVYPARTIENERVQLVRPLLLLHPAHQLIAAVHPLARGRQFLNFVISQPKDQRDDTGNIHYLLGLRSPGVSEILEVLESAGFPVSRVAIRISKLNIGGELSWRDFQK
jgi:hypothetical protein